MTGAEYKRRMGLAVDSNVILPVETISYIPKHEKRTYLIYRVLGPGGPQERYLFEGTMRQAILETVGCWDWCVTDAVSGKEVY